MRKQYTRFPLDTPHPAFKGEKSVYEPRLMVRVGTGHATTPRFLAVIDSGSPFCMFQAEVCELIGLELTSGVESRVGGIIRGPDDPIYFHKVKIYIEMDWVIEVMAGFVKKLQVPGILGRNGFFDNFHVKFDQSANPPAVEVTKIEKIQ
ncbi:MAG: hypothetical protein ACRD5M_12445 [Candidatus Acidiferrales bacterium]